MVRSKYDGKTYRNEVEAYRAMLENETGVKPSRIAAEVMLDREHDAYHSSGELAGIGPKRPFVEKI